MNTRAARAESPRVAAFRRMIAQIREVRIDGAEAYWLGDIHGKPLGPESDRTLTPFAEALALVQAGTYPEALLHLGAP